MNDVIVKCSEIPRQSYYIHRNMCFILLFCWLRFCRWIVVVWLKIIRTKPYRGRSSYPHDWRKPCDWTLVLWPFLLSSVWLLLLVEIAKNIVNGNEKHSWSKTIKKNYCSAIDMGTGNNGGAVAMTSSRILPKPLFRDWFSEYRISGLWQSSFRADNLYLCFQSLIFS